LDSGAIYRTLAYFLTANNLLNNLENEKLITSAIKQADIKFIDDLILLNGEDITQLIRTEEVASTTSQIASLPFIRSLLITKQRSFATANGLVADGRDMGLRIFPDAKYKVFLTASAEIRAKRRAKQLQVSDNPDKIVKIYQSITKRDERDKNNTLPADDALVIDNSDKNIDEVVSLILNFMQNKR
jgi:cytidylate kinase